MYRSYDKHGGSPPGPVLCGRLKALSFDALRVFNEKSANFIDRSDEKKKGKLHRVHLHPVAVDSLYGM